MAHSEICEVSLSTTGVRNAGRAGYNLTVQPDTGLKNGEVGLEGRGRHGELVGLRGRRAAEGQGGEYVGVTSRPELYIQERGGSGCLTG